MSKNIILFADGTGNKGGYTPSSNVYKLYHAIDLHNPDKKQITFYDNGVGTSTNKYLRGIGGAFGFGFETNVKDLYEFLARNYDTGDSIYIFGFSRGAATVRAFNGFMAHSGLIDGRGIGNSHLKEKVEIAFNYYRRPTKRNEAKMKLERTHELPKVKFIGVWDTVSALGFPEQVDKVGFGLRVIHQVLRFISWTSDKISPYKFYNYEITPNVLKARHALSIDDERTIFWPKVWDEKANNKLNDTEKTDIDQVWFAGMHSNVGGGYERQELANVSYDWMLENAPELVLRDRVREEARADANVTGRMYDSRLGAAAFYSYHPRFLAVLCRHADAPVNIHNSAMERMRLRSANYAPKLLPKKFNVVDMINGMKVVKESPEVYSEDWDLFHKKIRHRIFWQKWLYGIFLEIVLTTVFFIIYWKDTSIGDLSQRSEEVSVKIFNFVDTISPDIMNGFHYKIMVEYPLIGIGFAVGLAIFIWFRVNFRKQTNAWAERLRKLYISVPEGAPHPAFIKKNKTSNANSEN
jgi:uncharacterized protein (DUF2235 family)